MNAKPLFSFVVTARNDDYGGNWTNRINAFIRILAYQAQRKELSCELVFVEYNPPAGKRNLYSELNAEKNPYFLTRFIIVPNTFHKKLPNHEKTTVCEFIAKNIGIRRTSADWIIATNPDVLYGDDLFDFLANGKLDKNTYYRINRMDISTNKIETSLPAKVILDLASQRVIRIMCNTGTMYLSYREWLKTFIHGRTRKILLQCPLLNLLKCHEDENIIHSNAAGDFLCMHRSAWEKARGYDQTTTGSGIYDGYILYVLYCYGLNQKILPYKLFHIYHNHKGVTYLASHEKFYGDAKLMLQTKQPYKIHPENWGFPEEHFEEV